MASDISPPPTAARLPSLAGLRFVCAIAVFCAHAYVTLSFNGDWTGTRATVALVVGRSALSFFFVLSGFVMTWSARPGDTATAFWRRRAAKIYPTHVLTWFAALVLINWTGGQVTARQAVPNLLLLHSWSPDFQINNSVNEVSWSLSCEAFFYLSFPLLIRFLPRVSGRQLWAWTTGAVLGVILLPLIATTIMASEPKFPPFDVTFRQYWFVYLFPLTRLLEFVLGILLARTVREGRWMGIRFRHVIAALAVAYPVAVQVPFLYSITAVLIVPVAMLVLAAVSADIRGSRSLVRGPVMVKLGDITFAFYLVHLLVLQFAYRLLDDGGPASPAHILGSAALLFAVSLVLAWAMFTYVEQPLSRRWGARRPPKARSLQPSTAPSTDENSVAP
ncbi:acyltransferase family protein [Streptomyces sp. SID2888]|nr:acyltransferase family protein [Streptomyces sp. SID2888]